MDKDRRSIPINWVNRMLRYALAGGLGPFLIRALAGTGTVRIAAMAASFAVGVQLARGLGVRDYGVYSMALAVITIAAIPSELGLSRLVTREVAAASAQKDYAAIFGVLRWADRTCWRVSTVVAIAVAAAAAAAIATGPAAVGAAILAGIPMIPLLAMARLRAGALQGLHFIVRAQVSASLLRPLLFSVLLLFAFGIGRQVSATGAMALNLVTTAVALVVAALWLKVHLPPTVAPRAIKSRRMLASAIPLALTDGMYILQPELAILLLGFAFGAETVGLFRIAASTAVTASVAIPIVAQVAVPVIARLFAENDHERLQKAVTAFARAQTMGAIALSLPLLVAPELLLGMVFGEEYTAAADALRILAIGQIINASFGQNSAVLNMTHHERRVTSAFGFASGVTIVVVPGLAFLWGAAGAAAGLVTSLLCWNLLIWRDARRLLGIETSIMVPIFREARKR